MAISCCILSFKSWLMKAVASFETAALEATSFKSLLLCLAKFAAAVAKVCSISESFWCLLATAAAAAKANFPAQRFETFCQNQIHFVVLF